MPLVECVPNVSEGRRSGVIATLANALAVPGVHLLDQSSDPSHNRTVYTFVGKPAPLQQAVLQLFASAIAHIDLRDHRGVHPRIGAVDVVPFVPLESATMAECVELATSTAALVAGRYAVPVYLYEEAASRPGRRNLADIRRGGIEALAARMGEDEWRPDFGDPAPHPTAGASAIGARPELIAYNVNLASDRLDLAERIARTIRFSNGGFSHVKAMGVRLEHRGIVQVSMNLTDYHRTSMTTVFDAISEQAAKERVCVLESEIVGLVPAAALPEDPMTRLKLSESDASRVLERRLRHALAKG
jgi:glutamate formiminotransferase